MTRTISILILTVLSAVVTPAQAPMPPKVGDRAPDFALPNGDGKLVRLSEYTDRGPLLLIFYRGYW